MAKDIVGTIINVTAVIVAVTNDVPRVLIIDQNAQLALPNGPFTFME